MIEKIINALRNASFWADETFDEDGYSNDDAIEVVNLETAIDIVQEVAKEYDNASDNDLTVVSALPSLYPLQPFEEEAVHKVAASVKDGGWIPCSERLPEHMQQCLTTARIYYVPDHVDEPDNYIGVELNIYSKNFGWLHNPEVIAWQPLPAPYQKGE